MMFLIKIKSAHAFCAKIYKVSRIARQRRFP